MAWSDIQAAFEFEGECSADALSLLRVLAYAVGRNGYAYCGTEHLARKIGRSSRRTAQAAVNELVARGYVIRLSGRYSGHKNHYFLNIPGALAVNNPVYKSEFCKLAAAEVGKARQEVGKARPLEVGKVAQEVSKAEQAVGKAEQAGWANGDHGKENNETKKREQVGQEGFITKTPPVGTAEFRQKVQRVCNEAGLSQFQIVKFYEHNAFEHWAVLDRLPLEIAAQEWAAAWRKRDPQAWTYEQLQRMRARRFLQSGRFEGE